MTTRSKLKESFHKAAEAVIGYSSAKCQHVFTTLLTTPRARDLVLEGWGEISELPPVAEFFCRLREAAETAPVLHDIGRDPATMGSWLDEYLKHTFANLVNPLLPDAPGVPRAEAFWRGIDEWIFGSEITIIENVFVSNFDSEAKDLEVGDGLHLHLLSSEEIENCLPHLRMHHGIQAGFDANWELVWEYQATRHEYLHGVKQPSMIDAIQLSFRLLKPGGIGMRFWRHRSKYPTAGYGGFRGRGEPPRANGEVYHLLSSEVCKLKSLCSAIIAQDFVAFTPAKRFENSYHEQSPSDRLADLVIALEGLFVPDKGDSIMYRFALRAAKLLGQSPEEREVLFKKLKAVYSLRSILLHGGEADRNPAAQKTVRKYAKDLWELGNSVEDLVRRALQERLRSPERFSQEALDRLLLR